MIIPTLAIMAFPIGLLTGLFSQLATTLCTEGDVDLVGTWFCQDTGAGKFARSFLTGNLPSLLMTLYQSVILAKVVYAIAQAESRHFSLGQMDLRCGSLYFTWNVLVFFLGALLGGTIFNGLRDVLNDPNEASGLRCLLAYFFKLFRSFFLFFIVWWVGWDCRSSFSHIGN